ncbi:MAG TPA: gas vesicle protein GvpG [Gaiellaceae bacterium]|nr:gas vesicle protein GvpG [Gaiellaceae bacterium]
MGLFTGLLLLPLAPLRGTIWLAERLADVAESELRDESAIRRLLLEAEAALESGELSEPEYERIEDELLDRLDALHSTEPTGTGEPA